MPRLLQNLYDIGPPHSYDETYPFPTMQLTFAYQCHNLCACANPIDFCCNTILLSFRCISTIIMAVLRTHLAGAKQDLNVHTIYITTIQWEGRNFPLTFCCANQQLWLVTCSFHP